eukprot:284818071_5
MQQDGADGPSHLTGSGGYILFDGKHCSVDMTWKYLEFLLKKMPQQFSCIEDILKAPARDVNTLEKLFRKVEVASQVSRSAILQQVSTACAKQQKAAANVMQQRQHQVKQQSVRYTVSLAVICVNTGARTMTLFTDGISWDEASRVWTGCWRKGHSRAIEETGALFGERLNLFRCRSGCDVANTEPKQPEFFHCFKFSTTRFRQFAAAASAASTTAAFPARYAATAYASAAAAGRLPSNISGPVSATEQRDHNFNAATKPFPTSSRNV